MNQLNIMFITQEDPFYVRIFFEEFLRSYSVRKEIKGVIIAPAMGKKGTVQLAKQMYDFYGPVDFLKMGTKFFLYKVGNIADKIVGLKQKFTIEQVCRKYQIPVYFEQNLNGSGTEKIIKDNEVDLLISVAAPQIMKEKLLNLPKRGCINIHNSRLPKYRGMLPNFWQMYKGETEVGTTVHRINEKIDDGEILIQKMTPIEKGESLDSLIRRTKKIGALVMQEAIQDIKSGNVNPVQNSDEEATYYTFPTKKDVKDFRRKGYRLL